MVFFTPEEYLTYIGYLVCCVIFLFIASLPHSVIFLLISPLAIYFGAGMGFFRFLFDHKTDEKGKNKK